MKISLHALEESDFIAAFINIAMWFDTFISIKSMKEVHVIIIFTLQH